MRRPWLCGGFRQPGWIPILLWKAHSFYFVITARMLATGDQLDWDLKKRMQRHMLAQDRWPHASSTRPIGTQVDPKEIIRKNVEGLSVRLLWFWLASESRISLPKLWLHSLHWYSSGLKRSRIEITLNYQNETTGRSYDKGGLELLHGTGQLGVTCYARTNWLSPPSVRLIRLKHSWTIICSGRWFTPVSIADSFLSTE